MGQMQTQGVVMLRKGTHQQCIHVCVGKLFLHPTHQQELWFGSRMSPHSTTLHPNCQLGGKCIIGNNPYIRGGAMTQSQFAAVDFQVLAKQNYGTSFRGSEGWS